MRGMLAREHVLSSGRLIETVIESLGAAAATRGGARDLEKTRRTKTLWL